VTKNSFESDIVDGVVSIALAPNLGAVPDGTYYSVEYRLHRGEKSNELWIVPESEDPVSIADIRVLSVPAVGMAVSLSQVNGLPAVLDAKADKSAANIFTAPQVLRESAPGTSNPLLGLQKNDGAAGVYFRLPELSGDVTYTLPPNAGSPNQALTTDGSGALFWSSAAGGGAGSGSAYEVLQQGGTSVAQRTVANFASGFVVSDNAGQLRTDIAPNFGTTAGTITQGNDSRLSNARTPLAHAATHATGGSDPLTPLSIGALNRTNDFMVGTSPTTPVLKLQGSTGQAAALQEWRDGSGALAALITAQGNGFFRELGVSAPTGGTTVSQFFEVGGLKKFALSATDGVFDILRYDNAGVFLDRPLRVFRNGSIETAVSVKVADAAVGSGLLGLTGNYVELQGVAAPSNPASGFGRIFLNSSNGEVSVKKSSGSVVSLEQGGGSGGFADQGEYIAEQDLTDALAIGIDAELAKLAVVGDDADQVGLLVRGAAGASASLLEVQDAAGAPLLRVGPNGDLTIPGSFISTSNEPLSIQGLTAETALADPGGSNLAVLQVDRNRAVLQSRTTGGATKTYVSREEPRVLSWAVSAPSAPTGASFQWLVPAAAKVTRVDCSTDAGTVTIQLDERALSSPNSSGTDILANPLVCDADNQQTAAFADSELAAGALLSLDIDAIASSPTQARIHVTYTLD
jgi:hypothetical protein